MKKLFLLIINFILLTTSTLPTYGMYLSPKYTALKTKTAAKALKNTAIQKRTLYTPETIKGLYTNLPKEARTISPIHGITKFESGALQKIYAINSEEPSSAEKLVKLLFHQIGDQFKPTTSITKAAYALNPGIIGLVVGAAEVDKLEDPLARAYIIEQWHTEYEKIITDTKRPDGTPRPTKDIRKLMDKIDDKIAQDLEIIKEEYQQDKNSGRAILLGFLAAKADLTNDHDMIHYLSGINRFLPVIKTEQPTAFETFYDKLKSLALAVKDRITGSKTNQKDYTAQDYANFTTKAYKTTYDKIMPFALENFELAVSSILNARREKSLYPPKIVRSSYGYQGQNPRPNCVETAFQDLFNIILYNPETQLLDLSLLPTDLPLNNAFKKFYEDYKDINIINKTEVGQTFMDLVSNIPGAMYYDQKNYEMDAKESNFLIVANYFLGTNAQNLDELGNLLSDERRTINFTLHAPDINNITKISMVIKNNTTNKELRATLGFAPGHGEISVEDREKGRQKDLLSSSELATHYNISQEAQTLLHIQRPFTPTPYSLPASYYYTTSASGDWEKLNTIEHILKHNRHNKEALNYAYHLCQSLDTEAKSKACANIIKSKIWQTQPKFKKLLVDLANDILKETGSRYNIRTVIIPLLINHNNDQELIDYIYKLFQQSNIVDQHEYASKIIKSEIWKINKNLKEIADPFRLLAIAADNNYFPDEFINWLYEDSTDIEKKQFLANVLSAFAMYASTEAQTSYKIISLTKQLIAQGADINNHAIETNISPLTAAVMIDNAELVELLLNNGAAINDISTLNFETYTTNIDKNKYEGTALFAAITTNNTKITALLLNHSANPNISASFSKGEQTPLFRALGNRNKEIVKLLLEHGANCNKPNINSAHYNDTSYYTYPLNYAIHYNSSAIVDLLIQHGAPINVIDEQGKAPLDYAEKTYEKTVELLKQAGAKTAEQLLQEQQIKQNRE